MRVRRAVAFGMRGPPSGGASVADDAHVEAGAVEQVAKRHDQPARQQQHVEQQRADGGDAEDRRAPARAGCRTRLRAGETRSGVSSAGQRRARSRRSSVHDEASVASDAERHRDRRRDCSATRGVMRTKTSAVS